MSNEIIKSGGEMVVTNGNGGEIVEEHAGRLQQTASQAKEGAFVAATQGVATELGFKNVSQHWVKQCCTWDTLIEALERNAECNRDVNVPIAAMRTFYDVSDGELKVEIEDRVYDFSQHSKSQMCLPNNTGMGTHILGLANDANEREAIASFVDARWASFQKAAGDKKFFVRLRENGGLSVRAILSEKYGVIDHRWVADRVRALVGKDALISHFDWDAFHGSGGDFVRWNTLIPDHMRAVKGDDFGGMFSVGNSEVGTARFFSLPSIFSAICMNGCIWGQASDKRFQIAKKHLGNIDLDYLEYEMGKAINRAIPLLDSGIDHMFELQERETLEGGLIGDLQLLGYLADAKASKNGIVRGMGLDRTDRKLLYGSYLEQLQVEGERVDGVGIAHGAWSVVNAITRMAQAKRFSLPRRVELEMYAGGLLNDWTGDKKEERWEVVCKNAEGFDVMKDMGDVGVSMPSASA